MIKERRKKERKKGRDRSTWGCMPMDIHDHQLLPSFRLSFISHNYHHHKGHIGRYIHCWVQIWCGRPECFLWPCCNKHVVLKSPYPGGGAIPKCEKFHVEGPGRMSYRNTATSQNNPFYMGGVFCILGSAPHYFT